MARLLRVVLVAGLTAGVLIGSSSVASAQTSASSRISASAKQRPVVLVYRGPVSCAGCSEAAAAMVKKYNPRFIVRYVGPSEKLKLVPRSFRGVRAYVQPGGDVSVASAPRLIGARGAKTIRQYVARGGRYIGICQGAYLAGRPGLGLFTRGDSGQYIASRGAVTRTEGDTIVPVIWRGVRRQMFFQDGPYLIPNHVAGERVLARYTNGLVAALVTPYGNGKLGLVGPHPEAPLSWYSPAMRRLDKDGPDRRLGFDLLRTTIR